jgi:3-deoxy-D-manno-octulosonate 8-phosphate phosphatase (KDO 8-P phosphatase)
MRDVTAASWMQIADPDLAESCAAISVLVLNVDGVLTDGRLWLDARGRKRRVFSVRDALAIRRWRRAGGRVAVITELRDADVKLELENIGIDFLFEGCRDKSTALSWILKSEGLRASHVATFACYGSDLFLAQQGSVIFAASTASDEFLQTAHFITRRKAGDGAVAEACALLLRTRSKLKISGRMKASGSDS